MQSFKRTSVTSEVVLVLPFCNTKGSLLFWLGDGSTVISGPLGTATFLPTTASSSGRTKECLLRGCLEAAAAGIVFLSSLLIIGYSGVLSNNLARLIFSRKDCTLIFSRFSWSNNSYCFLLTDSEGGELANNPCFFLRLLITFFCGWSSCKILLKASSSSLTSLLRILWDREAGLLDF